MDKCTWYVDSMRHQMANRDAVFSKRFIAKQFASYDIRFVPVRVNNQRFSCFSSVQYGYFSHHSLEGCAMFIQRLRSKSPLCYFSDLITNCDRSINNNDSTIDGIKAAE